MLTFKFTARVVDCLGKAPAQRVRRGQFAYGVTELLNFLGSGKYVSDSKFKVKIVCRVLPFYLLL